MGRAASREPGVQAFAAHTRPTNSMASGVSIEVLDLRHFAAPMLRQLLDAEGEVWKERLHWDYRPSVRLLMRYLDNHMLPGYGVLDGGKVTGYAFCVYEETKAVIGDIFAREDANGETGRVLELEETLLKHLLETLLASPGVDRVESQLLLHPSGRLSARFEESGFNLYRRLFMVQQLDGRYRMPNVELPRELEMRPWRDEDLTAAGRLISLAYEGHTDSLINDQYRTVYGSQRFLHNIVRYSGCGAFSPLCSHVVVEKGSKEIAALVLGSRVSPESGHITQVCVHPSFRRHGIGRLLLNVAAFHFLRLGAAEVSLTVTESNTGATKLYGSEGYKTRHTFDAAVWERGRVA